LFAQILNWNYFHLR